MRAETNLTMQANIQFPENKLRLIYIDQIAGFRGFDIGLNWKIFRLKKVYRL